MFFAGCLLLICTVEGECQETVFNLLKNDMKLADEYFQQKDFKSALKLYSNIGRKHQSVREINLKIARCYYFLKDYERAANAYKEFARDARKMPPADIYYYAEALAGGKKYEEAIKMYREYLVQVPDDQLIIKKMWRLANIQFLYEDSLHYAVRPVPINTEYGELCPVPYKSGIVFMSNKKEVQPVEQIDASQHTPFYRLYYSMALPDTSNTGALHYSKPSLFSKEFNSGYHSGPVAFYQHARKIVFASTGNQPGAHDGRTLQLYFSERIEGQWKPVLSFPFNNVNYSITDPSITEDGRILFFSSDMPGGFGGRDLYRSEYIDGKWSKPVNLGEQINTLYDEVFPYLHNKTLYFSSNGHAGMGGLDIFKVDINDQGLAEVQNVGYPINTNHDEFGITIDSLDTHGYFSSNRNKGGYNDDIYEFEMDLQTYPVTITGLIKFKQHNWSDTSHLETFHNAKLFLVDNIRNVTVNESFSDGEGNFSISVPYFSKYKIRVVGDDQDEHFVSLEIPKHRKLQSIHEIVIVKDDFKPHDN